MQWEQMIVQAPTGSVWSPGTQALLSSPSSANNIKPEKFQKIHLPPLLHLRIDEVGALLLLARVVAGILVGDLAGGAGVELVQDTLGDTVEQLFGVDAEKVPGDVEGLVDRTRLVWRLADEGSFELIEELQGQLVFGGKGFLTDDCLHGGCWEIVMLGRGLGMVGDR